MSLGRCRRGIYVKSLIEDLQVPDSSQVRPGQAREDSMSKDGWPAGSS